MTSPGRRPMTDANGVYIPDDVRDAARELADYQFRAREHDYRSRDEEGFEVPDLGLVKGIMSVTLIYLVLGLAFYGARCIWLYWIKP